MVKSESEPAKNLWPNFRVPLTEIAEAARLAQLALSQIALIL